MGRSLFLLFCGQPCSVPPILHRQGNTCLSHLMGENVASGTKCNYIVNEITEIILIVQTLR